MCLPMRLWCINLTCFVRVRRELQLPLVHCGGPGAARRLCGELVVSATTGCSCPVLRAKLNSRLYDGQLRASVLLLTGILSMSDVALTVAVEYLCIEGQVQHPVLFENRWHGKLAQRTPGE